MYGLREGGSLVLAMRKGDSDSLIIIQLPVTSDY